MYFSSSQASRLLPIPPGPVIETSWDRRSPLADEILQETQLLLPADERGLGEVAPTVTAALGDHANRTPGRDRARLALQRLVAGRLERDRRAGRPHRGLADQHAPWWGDRLDTGGRVDEVARDHALIGPADRDGGLARHHARSGGDSLAELLDSVDQVEAGPDGPLGVVLAGRRGSPDGHDRVTDELLDRPAVPLDDPCRDREVARERVADVLCVLLLGERGEADQVGEQDAHESTLRAGAELGSPGVGRPS